MHLPSKSGDDMLASRAVLVGSKVAGPFVMELVECLVDANAPNKHPQKKTSENTIKTGRIVGLPALLSAECKNDDFSSYFSTTS